MAKRTASARKQARASVGRTLRNRSAKSEVKTRVTRVRKALGEHDLGAAAEMAAIAISVLDRVGAKGILHPNNAARRKSRLMKALNAAGAVGALDPDAKVAKKPTAKPKSAAAKKATVKKAIAAKKAPARTAAGKAVPARAAAADTAKAAPAPPKPAAKPASKSAAKKAPAKKAPAKKATAAKKAPTKK